MRKKSKKKTPAKQRKPKRGKKRKRTSAADFDNALSTNRFAVRKLLACKQRMESSEMEQRDGNARECANLQPTLRRKTAWTRGVRHLYKRRKTAGMAKLAAEDKLIREAAVLIDAFVDYVQNVASLNTTRVRDSNAAMTQVDNVIEFTTRTEYAISRAKSSCTTAKRADAISAYSAQQGVPPSASNSRTCWIHKCERKDGYILPNLLSRNH